MVGLNKSQYGTAQKLAFKEYICLEMTFRVCLTNLNR